jgi:O-antigen/teichoic acid export membrane protein
VRSPDPAAPPPAQPVPERAIDDVLDSRSAGGATIRGSAVRTIGYLVSMGLGLLSAPLLVRHLGIEDFGRYTAVISLVTLAGGISDAGLTSIAVREWATATGETRERLLRDLLGLRLLLALAGVALVTGFAAVAGYGSDLVLGTVLAGLGTVILVMQTAYSVPLQVDLRLGWVTAADVLRQAVSVALILSGIVAGASIVVFLAIPIPASLAALLLTLTLVWHRAPLMPSFHAGRWRTLVRDSLPVASAVALHNVYLRVVIVLMTLIATATEVGYFAASYRIIEILVAIPFLLSQTTLPVISRAAHTDMRRLGWAVSRLFEAGTVIGLGFVLAVLAGAPVAVAIFVGGHESDVVPVLRLQSAVLLFTFLTVTWLNALFALRRHRAMVITNGLGMTVAGVLTLVLGGPHGAIGAAAAAAIGELVLTLAAGFQLSRIDPALRPSLGFLPRVLLAAAIGLLPMLLPVPAIVQLVLVMALYATALVVLRALPVEVRDAALKAFGTLRRR